MDEAAKAFEGEPEWIIDQMLKRKREEVVKQWEERESRLERIRAKERLMEGRGSKRRRVDDASTKHSTSNEQDEDQWLLQDGAEGEDGDGGEASSFSKETRSLMEKLGMGALKQEEQDEPVAEDIKVRNRRYSTALV